MSKTKLFLFIQALVTFFVGLLLSSQGVPTDEVGITTHTVEELENTVDVPGAQKVLSDTKSALQLIGVSIIVGSVIELFWLGFLCFKGK